NSTESNRDERQASAALDLDDDLGPVRDVLDRGREIRERVHLSATEAVDDVAALEAGFGRRARRIDCGDDGARLNLEPKLARDIRGDVTTGETELLLARARVVFTLIVVAFLALSAGIDRSLRDSDRGRAGLAVTQVIDLDGRAWRDIRDEVRQL